MIAMKNLILQTDSYKLSHFLQYPQMNYMHDYIESRGGLYGYTRFFGLQYYLKKYLAGQVITMDMVQEAKEVASWHGIPFNEEGWTYIAKNLQGKLPLRIRAVPEGSVVKNHNALVTVESTDANVPWIVGWVETLLLKVWYPITVCSFSYKMRRMIETGLERTSDAVAESLPFKLHDFGYRGASSEETACLGGMSHLVNFMGTDTMGALLLTKDIYHAEQAGFSVPASEHSTTTAWKKGNEKLAFETIIKNNFHFPIISLVADSYDYFNAVDNIIGKELRDLIVEHEGFITIRPDSGDAITNILYALQSIERNFGVMVNSKGYKVLNKIRILQGDGISENTVYDILRILIREKWSVENVIFGCGGALLQGNSTSSINRDTHKFAMKCSAIGVVDENTGKTKIIDVYKQPITDPGKDSKKGRLDLIYNKETKSLVTVSINDLALNEYHPNSVLNLIFENGEIIKEYTFDEVKTNENLFEHQFPTGFEHE